MKAKPKLVTKSFSATLERMQSNLGWVIIRIPFDVAEIWGVRGTLRVKGEINGFAFRTALFPTGKGFHYLLVNKAMQKGAGATAGMTAQFRLSPDTKERKPILPSELKALLDEDRAFRRWYDQLTPYTRKWIGIWILQPKGGAARARRAEQIAERLLATMEAEKELPPILKAAFARDPRAYEGWQKMSLSHRRAHLLGIFYYRTPDARERRVAQMLEEASGRVSSKSRNKSDDEALE